MLILKSTLALPLVLAATCSIRAAGADLPAPAPEKVAPGIWRLHFGNPEQFTPTHFRSAAIDSNGLASLPAARSMPLDAAKISFRVSSRGCSVLLPMESNEHIYGLGLCANIFDMTEGKNGPTGRRVFLKPTDSPENELGESHAPMPFYTSTRGYGVFVDTARFASFYTGNDAPVTASTDGNDNGNNSAQTSTAELYRARALRVRTMLVDVPTAQGVDVYVFAGPTMLDAVERYNLFSGAGVVPPLWGLGVHYRGYAKYGAQESLALAKRIRDEHMPCDVWGVEPGWQTKTYSSSFVWNTNQFPDPNGFIRQMHDLGYRMNFWEHAFTHPSSPMYQDLKPWAGDYQVWGGLVPDFASPQGRAIFLRQNHAALFDRQVDGVKLDECDDQPESAFPWSFPALSAFPSGLDGEQMHSLFGLLYQKTMLAPYQEKNLRTWGLVRNSHALAAPLPYALYSDSYDPRCYVRAVANEGFSGLLWTPEVRDADSIEDLYRRIATVVFSADAVINSWFIKNPPWDQVNREKNNNDELMPAPERAAADEAVRKLLELRMRFLPYLYTAFNEYHATGKPPIRALVLDRPTDAKTPEIDDQFMFGDSVLVAPMFAGDSTRQVYLPAGDWYDFWTHAKLKGGGFVTATNGVEQIPLYVQSGTLLPLAEPVEHVKPDTCFDITVNVVGEHPADFTLYEDDGNTTAYAKGEQNQVVLHANGDQHTVTRTGNYHGLERFKVSDWKTF
jgi:alpha-D-xyloside xylohydrolase